ncbi:MAG: hypothetical protein FJ320_04150 [SAR202 cluster bacterium]|nr:hypothetical protein [SAR202 cluster bacterium]
MMPADEAARIISLHRGDAIAVASSRALDLWTPASQCRNLDLDLTDCPERVTAVALGLALARPHHRILALESDATLRSNVSSLTTVGTLGPGNLVHFLFRDSGHASTGGSSIPGLDALDFPTMARSAGYSSSFVFDHIEEMALAMEDVLSAPGPVFVTLNVYYDNEPALRVARSMAETFLSLKHALATKP